MKNQKFEFYLPVVSKNDANKWVVFNVSIFFRSN